MKTKKVTSRSLAVGFLIFSAALFFSSLFLVNCSTKENARKIDPVETQAQIAFEDLSAKLDVLNREFIDNYPNILETRRPRGWLVALMDIIGAGVGASWGGIWGALVQGITASVCTYLGDSGNITVSPHTPDNYIERVFESTEFDRLGRDHNLVLQNIIAEYGLDYLEVADADVLCNIILDEINELGYDMTGFSDKYTQCKTINKKLVENVKTGNMDYVYAMFIELNPEMVNEIDAVESYIETYSAIDPDFITEYSVLFRDLVTKSNISAESKQILQSAVSVGVGSNELWKTK